MLPKIRIFYLFINLCKSSKPPVTDVAQPTIAFAAYLMRPARYAARNESCARKISHAQNNCGMIEGRG
ncbi:hypothetical protein CAMGR0001_0468 [Campylobacter gracilis RM3268]|uniref:Uncharacterized protein n=1 Tax=Campylobacter gracilis RM3268 TaxID=553220 RepID=C8PHM3_9BACT|nr:hypothetical protein CAMGR0001_0468 [Campylobacter gracilis RM3268]